MYASLRCRIVGILALLAVGLLPLFATFALAQSIPPATPEQRREADRRAEKTLIDRVNREAKRASSKFYAASEALSRALSLPCLDADVAEGLIANANKAIAAIKNSINLLNQEALGAKLQSNKEEILEDRNLLSGDIISLNALILQLAFKPPCPPLTPRIAEPSSQPMLPPASQNAPQQVPKCALTPSEIALKKSLEESIKTFQARAKEERNKINADADRTAQLDKELNEVHFTKYQETLDRQGPEREKLIDDGAKQRELYDQNKASEDAAQKQLDDLLKKTCPETGMLSPNRTGVYLGGELVKNSGRVRTTETLAATGAITNQFSDSGDPIGAGIVAGYNFRPWNNNIVVGPFASFDWLNQTINHNFAGGQFLGTTTHWIATVGAKGGYVVTPGLYLYGLAGASWLNQSLNVNFATAASSNVTTPGFTLGLGGEYQPSSWRLLGNPVSVFLQYQHTWWGTANFNTPTSSPFSNYAFKREDDTIKLGVNIYLSH